MRTHQFLLILLLCPLALYGGQKKGASPTRRPDLTADVKLNLIRARQPCENYAWAAALQMLLAAQDVDLSQDYWIDRADGGQCRDHAASLEETARLLDGEYTLPTADGARRVRLTAQVTAGPPSADHIIAGLLEGHPALLLWKKRAYVLVGVLYDELTYSSGQKDFEIRELRLLNPLAPPDQPDTAVFSPATDDPATLDGALTLTATFCPTNVIVCR